MACGGMEKEGVGPDGGRQVPRKLGLASRITIVASIPPKLASLPLMSSAAVSRTCRHEHSSAWKARREIASMALEVGRFGT